MGELTTKQSDAETTGIDYFRQLLENGSAVEKATYIAEFFRELFARQPDFPAECFVSYKSNSHELKVQVPKDISMDISSLVDDVVRVARVLGANIEINETQDSLIPKPKLPFLPILSETEKAKLPPPTVFKLLYITFE